MKSFTCLTITIALIAPLLQQTPTPPQSAAEAKAKYELIEAGLAYQAGRFEEAQARSEKALLLDPQNKTALLYVARTIHAQYKTGDFTPENVTKARQAITAYQRILDRSPDDDESYKAVAYLYSAIKEDELLREWIFQRAGNVSIANDKRAEAYIVLASKDWDCSFKITELPNNKVTTVSGNKAKVSYKMPKDRVEFEQAGECANRALGMADMAIALTPESESAWVYKTNILLELAKLAEMSGEVEHQRELQRQYKEALNETTRLSKRSQSTP